MDLATIDAKKLSHENLISIFHEAQKALGEKDIVIQEKDYAIHEKEELLRQRAFFIEKLQHENEQLRRWRFGKRSEKVDPGQMHLFEMGKPLPVHVPVEDNEAPEPKKRPKRQKVQEDLPRDVVEHALPQEDLNCRKCGGGLTRIGEEVSEQYDYVPAKMRVRKTVRHKYGCRNRKCKGVVKVAEAPAQVIPKGNATAGLLSHILVSKYQDHLPLYRQCDIFRRHGVVFSRSTLSDWVMACGELLRPIVVFMEIQILKSKAIHTDDTVIGVLDPGRKRTRLGRLWVYLGGQAQPYTIFRYSPNRKGEHPQDFLKNYFGFVHADAFAGYDLVYNQGEAIEVACWAHARRKFFEAVMNREKSLEIWYIRELYRIEREAKSLPADERRDLRQAQSKSVLAKFKNHLENLAAQPKSPLGKAVTYTLNQWEALNCYLEDGDLSIDNNPAEQAIRPIAVGRKNWLFAGSDRGAHAAANICSIIATCKRHQVDPFVYLHDALTLLAEARRRGDIDSVADFTPLAWKNARALVEEATQNPTD